MDEKARKRHDKIQENVRKVNRIQEEFGGYRPDLINMYFAAKLESLTRILIGLTIVLAILTGIHIILLIKGC
ncbi:MAG: hypothetical protein A2Z77_05345 [Chloroflexi bacterium RBG_13_51_36]|nr:MAG: hypothetical protein A2Z77_05345 [Chloroflexi bacterium RBG_13_51_36]